jgi:hypothetical protein
MLSFYRELLTVLSWMFWKVMTECKLHDMAGSVTGCVFHQLMLEADWVEHVWEEQNMSLENFHKMEPFWRLWQKQEGNVVMVVTKYVLTISAGWGCGTLVGCRDDTDSALGCTRTKICFSVHLHIDCWGKIMCWLDECCLWREW